MDDEPGELERVVSITVPFFFGVIGLAGLLGNAMVVLGMSYFHLFFSFLVILL